MKDKIDMAADIPQSILANKDLIPSQQTWSWYNIFAFWMSDVHSAGGYIFAGTLFSLGLAGWQVFISLIAGILIILVLANIIGVPSQKFAIPFPVISRMITAASLLPNISRSVAQHQYQCLPVHTVQNVVHTPARCTRHLPQEAERAMGTLITGS